MTEVKRTLCNRDCPDACGLLATVEGGRVTKLRGDPEHPHTRGFLCYRTNQFLQRQYAADRLTQPLMRKQGRLTPVDWEEALEHIAASLLRIRQESGPAAIFHYRSGGSLGMLKALSDRMFEQFGPVTVKRGDICSGAGEAAQVLDFGLSDSSAPETLLEARHILLWGKNVHVSSPHTIPILKQAISGGAEVTLIDPVHHDGTRLAQRHLCPAPGGDLALALATGRLLFESDRHDATASQYCDNLEQYRSLCFSRTVSEWCEQAGVTPSAAEHLANQLGSSHPCAIVVGWGMGRRSNGGAIVRAIDALGAISGNLGIPGGGVSFYFQRRSAFKPDLTGAPSTPPRTIAEPRFGQEIMNGQSPAVRALWVTAGNPVAMLPDSALNARAVRSLELSVVVDSFLTDTARCANVVLPTTTLLEDDDIFGSYGTPYLGVSQPVVAPPAEVRTDLQILQALAPKLGLGNALAGSARTWKEQVLSDQVKRMGVNVDALELGPQKNPLAPHVVFHDRKFPTATGKVQLLTEVPLNTAITDPQFPLTLMALSTRNSQSSQWTSSPPSVLPLTIHPASTNAIPDGALARLASRHGEIQVVVRHDARQRRDTAVLPKGGHLHVNACANSLLPARLTDLGEGGALYEEPVRLLSMEQ